jgi:PAS domain S-box-containing protein
MDMDLNLTFVTPSVEKITGIPIEQYLKRSIEEKYPQSSLEKIRSLIKEELKNEKKQSVERTRNKIIEIQEYKADGSLVWISINASFIRDKNGAPIGFQGVTRDITAKKDAEEKLRKNKEKLLEINTVLTSLGSDYNKNINNLTSLAGRILKSTCAIYNRLENGTLYSAGQWQTPEDYNPKYKPEGHICFDVIKQAEQKPFILKNLPKSKYAETDPNVTKYGLQTYVGFPVFCGREIIGCLCVVFQDNVELEEEDTRVLGLLAAALKNIEEQKKSKQEKEELQKQLLQAKKMEAVGTLAGGISHDFNNLLQIITGYIEIIKLDTKPDSDNYRRLEGIEKSAAKGANLVNQLLHFSRKKEIARQPLNLNQEIAKTEIIFKRTIPKTISIEYNLDSQLWNINADSSQIGQVLLNLISNASDAMRGSGKLSIKTKNMHLKSQDCEILPGNYVVLSISDTGEGMDKNTAQNIFDPFFTTKETGKGTGLGLATVYGIVTSHNGYIKYTSQPGRGTRFDIYLPAEKNLELNEKEKTANQPATGNKTILIVDDEDQIREITEINLSKLGYKTLQAPDGRKAVKTYQNQKEEIDLIILDINMPNMDGIECMRQLLKINPKAKIILASGYPLNPENAQEIAGHAGTMQKPFTKNDLSAKLKEVLN